jgi:hypothetical protein
MWDWIALVSSTRKYAIDLCTTISPYYPTCWYVHLHVPPNGEVFLGVREEEFPGYVSDGVLPVSLRW